MPHIELLPNQTSALAPGWAYVPESHYTDPSKAAFNPSGARARHKSAAALAASSGGDLTARQQTAIQRRLAELDRDAPTKEMIIPKSAAGGGGGGGKTQATRKILGSMKGWRNWLDDDEAMVAMAVREGGYGSHAHTQIHGQASGSGMSTPVDGKRGKGNKRASLTAGGELGAEAGTPEANVAVPDKVMTDGDVRMMEDAEDCDDDPLLQSRTLGKLSPDRLEALLSGPPLSYNAARAAPPDPDAPPPRQFCELCGYWGRVRCLKCGTRVCGLDCKVTHDAECSRRFC